eukprot:NODE_756_length_1216_cov_172.393939_g716_i0.p1 GENE.NODE_756_length_1216_cov_172.393939_g716_i0~~NODE_756_length_1216_cov_172.393939_g716_i0.p1  ORF type:complete len:382 (-),score=110.21 NODE_756_length_1216_cov_172.393939_g716_i0:69-1157(-)
MKTIASLLALATAAQAGVFSRMFVSQPTNIGDGDWGASDAYTVGDAICASESGDMNFVGFFSADGTNMKTIPSDLNAKVVNTNGDQISPDFNTLFSTTPASGNVLAFDGSAGTQTFVWTGTQVDGTQAAATCFSGTSWNTNSAGVDGEAGFATLATGIVRFGSIACDTGNHGIYCVEKIPSSSGTLDPHFFGFNGEKLDIEHDDASADRTFSVFCNEDMSVNALFSATTDGLLFMTKFWLRFEHIKVEYGLDARAPVVIEGEYEREYSAAANRTVLNFDDKVRVEYTGAGAYVSYGAMKFNMEVSELANDEFLNINIISSDYSRFPAGGIVGRTMERRVPKEEFEQYSQYLVQEPFAEVCNM